MDPSRPDGDPSRSLQALREAVHSLVLNRGYERREDAFQLSSGQWSHDYIDGKRALATGSALRQAAECMLAIVDAHGAEFDAVGGLTMGADHLAHAIALLSLHSWFSVRKEAKRHGRQRLVEGCELHEGMRVVLVDDVVTTGASILKALDAIEPMGALVVLAMSLADRGESARPALEARGVLYDPVMTYRDLGIEPVG